MDSDPDAEDLDVIADTDLSKSEDSTTSVTTSVELSRKEAKARARDDSLAKLQGGSPNQPKRVATVKRRPKNGPDAVIVLKEERVRASQLPHCPILMDTRHLASTTFSNLSIPSELASFYTSCIVTKPVISQVWSAQSLGTMLRV